MSTTRSFRARRRAATAVTAAALGAASLLCPGLAAGAFAETVKEEPTLSAKHRLGSDGMTEPVYDFDDAIIEHAYVEADMDTDGDGEKDLIRADLIRPDTAPGETVPSIITASGYYGTPGGKPYIDDANRDTSGLAFMPDFYDNYFVPRGYAYLSVDVAGTNWSEGCVDDVGPNDVESVAAVIRWLHGEQDTVAYRNLDRAEVVGADWSSGHSAVTGISYDGGIANAVATSPDVPGLETVVPIAGGSSAYNTRPNGVFVGGGTAEFSEWLTDPERPEWVSDPTLPPRLRAHQAEKLQQCQASFDAMRAESDPRYRTYNDFWKARNFTDRVDQIKANGVSVFIGTGQGDMIVRTNEFATHWQALQEAGVESKLWLHLRGHIDPFDADQDAWMSDIHRWYDHELLGVENGITGEPAARVETGPGQWIESETWPVTGAVETRVGMTGATADAVGALGTDVVGSGSVTIPAGSLVDTAPFELTGGRETPTAGDDRLVFVSAPYSKDSRVSGTPSVTLRVKASAADMNLSAALVDYGPGTYVDWGVDAGVTGAPGARTWGSASALDNPVIGNTQPVTAEKGSYVFTRGTGNTAHYTTIERYTPATTDSFVDLTWDLMPADHIIPGGHRLGIILYNNSNQYDSGTVNEYVGWADAQLDLAGSSVTIPSTIAPRSVADSVPDGGDGSDGGSGTGGEGDSGGGSDVPITVSGSDAHTASVTASLASTGFDVDGRFVGAAALALIAGAGLLVRRSSSAARD